MIAAVIICLAMVRLGFWQLDRAEQKKVILQQSIKLSEQVPVDVENLLSQLESASTTQRFRQVTASGHYLPEESILIDNQVFNSKVGYALLTPFKLSDSGKIVLIDRGWLTVGESREQLPKFKSPVEQVLLAGRLNVPYAKPPIWNDKYPVSDGMVWQYLPIDQFRQQTGLDVAPLVLELAPNLLADSESPEAKINWQLIDDEWVFKHQAYALQWFSMAAAFFIACVIVLLKTKRNSQKTPIDYE